MICYMMTHEQMRCEEKLRLPRPIWRSDFAQIRRKVKPSFKTVPISGQAHLSHPWTH